MTMILHMVDLEGGGEGGRKTITRENINIYNDFERFVFRLQSYLEKKINY